MSALEKEIIEKFHQLQPAAKQRVLALIEQEVAEEAGQADAAAFDYALWFREVEAIRLTLRPDASGHSPTASELVNEAREERDAELLGSIGLRDSAGDSTN